MSIKSKEFIQEKPLPRNVRLRLMRNKTITKSPREPRNIRLSKSHKKQYTPYTP